MTTSNVQNAIKKGYDALNKRYSTNAAQVLELAKHDRFNAIFDTFALGYSQGIEDAKAEIRNPLSNKGNTCSTEEIEKIYYTVRLEGCPDFPDTAQERDKAYEKFVTGVPSNEAFEAEEIINDLANAKEKQGFVYGFQYAVKLLMGNN